MSLDVYGVALMGGMHWNFVNDMGEENTIYLDDRLNLEVKTKSCWHRQLRLEIHNVYLSDNGIYKCVIKNLFGIPCSYQCDLHVERREVIGRF